MLQKLNRKQEGFTIIEVLIVLAIAGLIMLIVFLAVPALQRHTRNNGRTTDASHIATAINDYVSNNNGALPTTATAWCTAGASGTSVFTAVQNDVGNFDQYKNLTCSSTAVATQTALKTGDFDFAGPVGITNGTPNSYTTGSATGNSLLLVDQAQCQTNNGSTETLVGASTTQAALVYSLETGSSTWNEACLNVQ